MLREELLPLVVRLGRAFARRGMREHALKLRLYYFALRHKMTRGNDLEVRWSERLVVDWMKTLRVPPYDSALPIRPRASSCTSCKQRGQQPWIFTDGVFPGGVRMRCQSCGEIWLEEDATAP